MPRYAMSALFLLLCGAGSASAQSAREQLDAFAKGLQTATVTFRQVVTGPGGGAVQTAQGSLQMRMPDRFRWEYLKPNPQLIVADGKRLWIYEPDLKQVTVKPQDALRQDNPLAAIADPALLPRYYRVSERPAANGLRWLQLVPLDARTSPFDKAWLGFSDGSLRSMRLFDSLGQVSEFSFGVWRRNPALAPSRFVFTVPKDVDVVE